MINKDLKFNDFSRPFAILIKNGVKPDNPKLDERGDIMSETAYKWMCLSIKLADGTWQKTTISVDKDWFEESIQAIAGDEFNILYKWLGENADEAQTGNDAALSAQWDKSFKRAKELYNRANKKIFQRAKYHFVRYNNSGSWLPKSAYIRQQIEKDLEKPEVFEDEATKKAKRRISKQFAEAKKHENLLKAL